MWRQLFSAYANSQPGDLDAGCDADLGNFAPYANSILGPKQPALAGCNPVGFQCRWTRRYPRLE